MPALNRLTWFGFCLCVVVGTSCSTAVAQTTTRASRYASGETSTVKQAARRQPEEGDAPIAPGKAALNNRNRGPANAAGPVQPAAQLARPVAQAMRIRKVTPEMEEILQEWEQKSSKVKRLEGKFKRYTYDPVFEVETVSEGQYCFQFPDKGSFDQKSQKIVEGMKSTKLRPNGEPYQIQPGDAERWVCDGEHIFKIDEKTKTFEKIQIPNEDRGQNIRNAPLPFVFGLKAAEAKQRYEFELDLANTNEDKIRVKVRPLLQQDIANYKEAEVILDRTNCLPLAVKLTDPTGKKTDVYSFQKSSMVVNSKGWTRWLGGDPLKPNFSGLKQMVHKDGPGDQNLGNAQPDRLIAPSRKIGPNPLTLKRTAELPEEEAPPIRRAARTRTQTD